MLRPGCNTPAAAGVPRRYTRSDGFGAEYLKPPGSMALEAGMPNAGVRLGWAGFSAAAQQAGLARIDGGIHFDNGNAAGPALRQQVGALAFARAQRLWTGAG